MLLMDSGPKRSIIESNWRGSEIGAGMHSLRASFYAHFVESSKGIGPYRRNRCWSILPTSQEHRAAGLGTNGEVIYIFPHRLRSGHLKHKLTKVVVSESEELSLFPSDKSLDTELVSEELLDFEP
ncbi:hypothetical protein Tco_1103676 [Tanacetum coccineum]